MIIDLILIIFQGVLSILLAPLELINISIDFVSSIPVFMDFLSVVAYVLPWSNIMPLILLLVGFFVFRIAITIIKTVWKFIPIFGN